MFVEDEEAVTMATGCGMRRMRRRIVWDREESFCCGVECTGCLDSMEEVDEKGRCRHSEVVNC